MTLYTIHSSALYEILLAEKTLVNTGNYMDDVAEAFLPYYEWMADQMVLYGLERPENNSGEAAKYPFWAWYKYSDSKTKPDLRHAGHAPRGTNCVCLELELPENDVLLSNFDSWNCVLNNHPVFPAETWDSDYENFKLLPVKEQELMKKKTWQSIFSDFLNNPVQATFWKLDLETIRDVRFFKAR